MGARMRRLLAVVVFAAGCSPGPLGRPGRAAAPMNTPVPTSSEPGSGNVEATRRTLFGTWELVALEAVPPGGGARAEVTASRTLTYDEYGNLTIDAQTTHQHRPRAPPVRSLITFSCP